MFRSLRIGGLTLATLLGLALLGLAVVWIAGGVKLGQKFDAPIDLFAHSNNQYVVAAGERLAMFMGCEACHGENLQGNVMAELPEGSKLVAPNIARIASEYTDADLVRAIRYGVRQDRTGLIVMPSDIYFAVNDKDMIALISHIRSLNDEGAILPAMRMSIMPRFLLMTGEFEMTPLEIGDLSNRPSYDLTDPIAHGNYLARVTCALCHGLDLGGRDFGDGDATPDLTLSAAYSPDEFRTLIKTGVGLGDRDLGLMSEVARENFSQFTDEEIDLLYRFLLRRAEEAE